MDPFYTLPYEVLVAILDKLKTSEDLAACSRAHPAFASILEPTKPSWLFYQILSSVVDFLSRDDILRCRLVCLHWKSAVDTFLHEPPNVSSTQVPFPEESLKNWHFWPRTSRVIMDFMKETDLCLGSSFVTRRLRLGKDYGSLNNGEMLNDYWSHVQQLLSRIGSLVYRCRFSFEETPVNLIYILRGCLSHLPNLKSVEISHINLFGGSNRRMNGLAKSLQDNPFPRLHHLEHLFVVNVPDIFFQLVFPLYADSLKVFEYFHAHSSIYANSSSEDEDDNDRNLPSMPNLESMHFTVNQECLLKFPSCAPNLTKLVISCPQIRNGRVLGKILHCCKTSLKKLAVIYRFTLGDRVGESFTNSFPDEMSCLQEIMVVNPSSDWLEIYFSVGSRSGKKVFCLNIEKLSVQWRARDLDCLESSNQALPVVVNDMPFDNCEGNETWIEVNECLHNLMYNKALWKQMSKLQSCHLSAYSLMSKRRIFSAIITRNGVLTDEAYQVRQQS